LSYKVLTDGARFAHTSQKSVIPPQGAAGGRAGASGYWVINEGTEGERRLVFAIGDLEVLARGDTVTHYGAGGGGYGDPREREPALVLADVTQGLVSRARAESAYGVALVEDGAGVAIDEGRTAALRAPR
jgi:N-methylhydantoinase B